METVYRTIESEHGKMWNFLIKHGSGPEQCTVADVAAITGYSPGTVRNKAQFEPDFPQPNKRPDNTIWWPIEDILSYAIRAGRYKVAA